MVFEVVKNAVQRRTVKNEMEKTWTGRIRGLGLVYGTSTSLDSKGKRQPRKSLLSLPEMQMDTPNTHQKITGSADSLDEWKWISGNALVKDSGGVPRSREEYLVPISISLYAGIHPDFPVHCMPSRPMLWSPIYMKQPTATFQSQLRHSRSLPGDDAN
jgi:hypothetical protein